MTDHAGRLIERLNGVGFTLATDRKYASDVAYEAASAIASLVKERDALKIESSKHAYEADKAKQDRDTAERRSEDFWSGRVASAEARCARLEEAHGRNARAWHDRGYAAGFKAGVECGMNGNSDEINLRLAENADDLRRARQALEEQG